MVWVSRLFCGHFKKLTYRKLTITFLQTFETTGTFIFKKNNGASTTRSLRKRTQFGFLDLSVVIVSNYLTRKRL